MEKEINSTTPLYTPEQKKQNLLAFEIVDLVARLNNSLISKKRANNLNDEETKIAYEFLKEFEDIVNNKDLQKDPISKNRLDIIVNVIKMALHIEPQKNLSGIIKI